MISPTIKKIIAYLSVVVIILYLITGYGLTKSETVTKLTFGLLTRSLSFKIHTNLLIPLIILLVAHLILACNLIPHFREENNIPENQVSKKSSKKN